MSILQVLFAVVAITVLVAILPIFNAVVMNVNVSDAIATLSGQGYTVLAQGQEISTDLIPSANNTYSIGSHPDGYWKEAFIGVSSLHLGGVTLSGENGMFSTGSSPISVEDGLILYDPVDEEEKFHMFVSGIHQQFADIPEAFDEALIFETSSIDNPYNMEVVFWDTDTERPALVINEGEAARASVFERSLIVGAQKGTKALDGQYTIGTSDFPNLGFDTSITGADFGVEDDVEILGTLYIDEIRMSESSSINFPDPVSISEWASQNLAGNGYAQIGSVMLQWGVDTSTQDTAEVFRFPTEFPTAVSGVQITRANADASEGLPVTAGTTETFTIDRNDDIDGDQVFSWFAIGY